MAKHLAPKSQKDDSKKTLKFNISIPKKNAPAGRHSSVKQEVVDEEIYDDISDEISDEFAEELSDEVVQEQKNTSASEKSKKFSFSLPKRKASSGRHSGIKSVDNDQSYSDELSDEELSISEQSEDDISVEAADIPEQKKKLSFSLPKRKPSAAGKHSRVKVESATDEPAEESFSTEDIISDLALDPEQNEPADLTTEDESDESVPEFNFSDSTPDEAEDSDEYTDSEESVKAAKRRRKIGLSDVKNTVTKAKNAAQDFSAFIISKKEGLSGVALKDSYREHIENDITDAVMAGIMSVIAIVCLLLKFRGFLAFILAFAEVLVLGRKIISSSIKNIRSLSFFHEGIILLVCIIGGFCTGNPQNAVLITAAYTLAGFVRSLSGIVEEDDEDYELEDIPEAWVRGSERVIKAPVEDLKPGNTIYIDVNSEIPVDGIVLQGSSKVDRHKLSRVMMTTTVGQDDYVYAGDINITGQLCVKVLRKRSESAYYDIQKVKENCVSGLSESERKFAVTSEVLSRLFVFAGLAVIIGSLFFKDAKTAVQTIGVCLLMLSCTGLDFVPNIYKHFLHQSTSLGTVFASKTVFDNFADADTVVFDKTGIITDNTFKLVEIKGNNVSKEEVLQWAAAAEYYSVHPIAKFLKATVRDGFGEDVIKPIEELPGLGVGALVDDHIVYVGNERLLRQHGLPVMMTNKPGVVCHISKDNQYLGYILLSETVNTNAFEFTESLKSIGMGQLVMMTGSSTSSSKQVVRELSVDLMKCELLPEGKEKTMDYLAFTKKGKSQLVYLNRGQNVFDIAAKADISVSIAGLEERADIFASDIYMFNNDVSVIPGLIYASRSASGIIKQNKLLIAVVNAGALALTCIGFLPTGLFALIHFGVSAVSYINSMRKSKI